MSILSNLTARWHESINQIEKNETAMGGSNGNINLAPKQLFECLLWIKEKLGKLEPIKVGDTYHTTLSHANAAAVATHHGYGTWERYSEGRTLVGFSTKSSDPDDYKTMGNEFGENEHTLTVDEMPSHNHPVQDGGHPENGFGGRVDTGTPSEYLANSKTVGYTGGDQPHNNIQPVVVVAYWVRTA